MKVVVRHEVLLSFVLQVVGHTINPDDASEVSYSCHLEHDSDTVDVVLGHQSFDYEIVRFDYVIPLLLVFEYQLQLVIIIGSNHWHEEFWFKEAVELAHPNHFQEVKDVQYFKSLDLAD